MKFNEMELKLKSELDNICPYIFIRFETNLMDCIHIRFSKQSKENWENGIFQNSDYTIFHIFCLNERKHAVQRENDLDLYKVAYTSGKIKIRSKTDSGEKIANYIINFIKGQL